MNTLTSTPTERSNLKRWIEALRSGNYQQGKDVLLTITPESDKKYCCLGVACNLMNIADRDIEGSRSLRFDITRQFGLSNPRYIFDERILANMNDAGSTFTEIADDLEFYLELLNTIAESEESENLR